MSKVKLLLDVVANLADYDTRDDAPCTVQQRVHLHPGAYRAITGSPLV